MKWGLRSLFLRGGQARDCGRNDAMWLPTPNHKTTWPSSQDAPPQNPDTLLRGWKAATRKRLQVSSAAPAEEPQLQPDVEGTRSAPSLWDARKDTCRQARPKLHIHEQNKWWYCFKSLNVWSSAGENKETYRVKQTISVSLGVDRSKENSVRGNRKWSVLEGQQCSNNYQNVTLHNIWPSNSPSHKNVCKYWL